MTTKVRKARLKKPAVMKVLSEETPTAQTENPELSELSDPIVEPSPTPVMKPLQNVTKLVRQPDVELSVDPILTELIRSYEAENAELKRQYEENNRARKRAIDKVLAMNAVKLRINSLPYWKGDFVLCVPVPDVVTQVANQVANQEKES